VFFHVKGLSAKYVHVELVQVVRSDAIANLLVTKYMRRDLISQNEPEVENRAKDQDFSIIDNAILEALEIMTFVSIGQIATMIFIPSTTGFCRLTKSVHFVLKGLRWASHRLSDLQKIGSDRHVNGVTEAA
jgi:hypothetical protein